MNLDCAEVEVEMNSEDWNSDTVTASETGSHTITASETGSQGPQWANIQNQEANILAADKAEIPSLLPMTSNRVIRVDALADVNTSVITFSDKTFKTIDLSLFV